MRTTAADGRLLISFTNLNNPKSSPASGSEAISQPLHRGSSVSHWWKIDINWRQVEDLEQRNSDDQISTVPPRVENPQCKRMILCLAEQKRHNGDSNQSTGEHSEGSSTIGGCFSGCQRNIKAVMQSHQTGNQDSSYNVLSLRLGGWHALSAGINYHQTMVVMAMGKARSCRALFLTLFYFLLQPDSVGWRLFDLLPGFLVLWEREKE